MEEGKPAQTIRAERGDLSFAEDGNTLVMKLYEGEIHDVDEKDPKRYLRLKFTEHTLNIADAGGKLVRVSRDYRGEREMSIGTLRTEIAGFKRKMADQRRQVREALDQAADSLPALTAAVSSGDPKSGAAGKIAGLISQTHDRLQTLGNQEASYGRSVRSYSVELHKKIAMSFACLVFVLLGIPIGATSKEGGTGAGMVASISVFAVYYAFLKAGETLADRGYVAPFLAMWAANILLGSLGAWLLFRANSQLSFVPDFVRRIRGG